MQTALDGGPANVGSSLAGAPPPKHAEAVGVLARHFRVDAPRWTASAQPTTDDFIEGCPYVIAREYKRGRPRIHACTPQWIGWVGQGPI